MISLAEMSKMLLANSFQWIIDTSQLHKDFITNYNEDSDQGYFLEVDVLHLEKLH